MKIGIIVAMDKEFTQLEKVFHGNKDIILQKCGIGKVNSAVGTTQMIAEHHPDLIISTGCARYLAPTDLVEKASRLQVEGITIHKGLTVSGEWFVDTREKMQDIMSHFPEAMAVDMESCSIAQVCHIFNTPFISFRIISDVPLKDHKAQMYFDFWDRLAEGSFEVTRHFIEEINK